MFVTPPPEQQGNVIQLERPLDPETLQLHINDPSRPGLPEDERVRVRVLPLSSLLVLHIGNARQITDWALMQEDPNWIFGAIEALMEIIAAQENEQEVTEAQEGYLYIHQKMLSGWPERDLTDGGAGHSLLYYSRDSVRRIAQKEPDNQSVQVLWQRITELDAQNEDRQ